jgi:hypothetical protein
MSRLLEGFTAPDGRLVVIDLARSHVRRQRPREVAAVRDYHRIDVPNVDPAMVEDEMARVEGVGIAALGRIIEAGGVVDRLDLEQMAGFLALHAARSKRVRDQNNDVMDRVGKTTLALALETKERWMATRERMRRDGVPIDDNLTYEGMVEFSQRGEFALTVDNNTQVLQVLAAADAILPLLCAREWALLVAETGAGPFVCSNDPVGLCWCVPRPPGFHGPGFGLPGTDVTFPLDSKHALLGRFGPLPGNMPAGERLVAAVNSMTCHGATEVYAAGLNFPWVDGAGTVHRDGLLEAWTAARLVNPPTKESEC